MSRSVQVKVSLRRYVQMICLMNAEDLHSALMAVAHQLPLKIA